MENKIQPRPQDSADEKTIEVNLKNMDYPPKEDIMRQDEEVEGDLETTGKQASTTKQVSPLK